MRNNINKYIESYYQLCYSKGVQTYAKYIEIINASSINNAKLG